jgi:hypothetical protein
MRIEFIEVNDDLAAEADRLFPESTWSELVEYALSVVVDMVTSAGEDSHAEVPV